ncbi:MAG TPA: hypothetical protein VF450_14025 [Noviherbaspirillum sp.]
MPRVTCDDCKHFVRDKINPPAGVGHCGHPKRKEFATFYPMERHLCRAHSTTNSAEISSKLVGAQEA